MNISYLMNISDPINKKIGNALSIDKNSKVILNNFFRKKLSVKEWKEGLGDRFLLDFDFCGDIDLKIGISRIGYSFTWIYENEFTTDYLQTQEIDVDLSPYFDGELEIHILGLKDSIISLCSHTSKEIDIDENDILYRFIFPTLELCCEEQLYCKLSGEFINYNFRDTCVYMGGDTLLDLLTYYNSFSSCKWSKYTNIKNISLFVDFCGEGKIEVVHKTQEEENILCTYIVKSEKRKYFGIPIGRYPGTGIIGIRLYVYKPSVFYGGGWISSDLETQKVKLGIGITTYRREEAVKNAVRRLRKAISSHPIYNKSIDITVVDNGKTLKREDVEGVALIPNHNLGGTGGFMRNLLVYKNTGTHTHVLFMDDDASCEPSSVFRSVSFMRHALDDSTAISGAMLSENIQFIQWENGAWFDKCCHPLHCNYDLRDADILVKNEEEDSPQATYGAWWFFMFPIKHVTMFSFPFFVRGDDIEFSYLNKFNIVRMNGISTWQEDFKIKESPMTLYLDIRSHVLHHLVLEHIDKGPKVILKMVWAFFSRFNQAYQYDTANAIACSFRDVQKGPKYWLDNMDTSKIRADVKKKYIIETLKDLRDNYQSIPEAVENVRLPFLNAFLRKFSLNGHLLPNFLVKKNMERLNKYQIPFANRMFLRNRVLICNEIVRKEMILIRDRKYYFSNLFTMIGESFKFLRNYNALKNEYKEFYKEFGEDVFWNNIFQA